MSFFTSGPRGRARAGEDASHESCRSSAALRLTPVVFPAHYGRSRPPGAIRVCVCIYTRSLHTTPVPRRRCGGRCDHAGTIYGVTQTGSRARVPSSHVARFVQEGFPSSITLSFPQVGRLEMVDARENRNTPRRELKRVIHSVASFFVLFSVRAFVHCCNHGKKMLEEGKKMLDHP